MPEHASPGPPDDLLALLFPEPHRVFANAAEIKRYLKAVGVADPVFVRGDRWMGRRWFTVMPRLRTPHAYTQTPDPDADLAALLRDGFTPPGGFLVVAKIGREGTMFASNDGGAAAAVYDRVARALRGANASVAG